MQSIEPRTRPAAEPIPILVVLAGAIDAALVGGLADCGFALAHATSLGDAVRKVMLDAPAAIMVLANGAAAIEQCEVLSALGPHPLIVAGPALEPAAAAACLDKGADTALSLPLPAGELAMRIRAVLRRTIEEDPAPRTGRLIVGDLVIDQAAHTVAWHGAAVELSPTEFELLLALAEEPGRVITNQELLSRIWGEEYVDDVHYVRLYIGYLRGKLEDDSRHPKLILNQWGVGYRLALPG